MLRAPWFRIRLAKGDFTFSAAHFTLFEGGGAELLHGHNYRVEVKLGGATLDGSGLLVDLDQIKAAIRESCHRLDGRTLLAGDSPELRWRREGELVEVELGARRYRFPADEVVVLPLVNSSIELLAGMLWEDLAPVLRGSRVETLGVLVEETDGQGCLYEAPLGER